MIETWYFGSAFPPISLPIFVGLLVGVIVVFSSVYRGHVLFAFLGLAICVGSLITGFVLTGVERQSALTQLEELGYSQISIESSSRMYAVYDGDLGMYYISTQDGNQVTLIKMAQ